MRITAHRFWFAAWFGAASLILPLAVTPLALRADDHDQKVYHDRAHNDDHRWSDHEDKAYRIWVKENHRKYRGFEKLKDDDRQSYWGWRHEHPDTVLKIDVR